MRERFKTAALMVMESRDGGEFLIQSVDRERERKAPVHNRDFLISLPEKHMSKPASFSP